MSDDTISLLNWCKDTIGIRACHPDYPTQANTRVGYVNQALRWEWSLGKCCQPSKFGHDARQNVCRRRRHIVPSLLDFVSNRRPFADRGSNDQLRGVVLLRLKQDQLSESLDWFVIHLIAGHVCRLTSRMSYRRRETHDARLAHRLSNTQRLPALRSIRSLPLPVAAPP